ncbi:MAG: hypothetical protein HYV09_29375 [Deltaproteobacteria bacterium]|nr:hypothetical protein [Deltaproteobacteria bacterium]
MDAPASVPASATVAPATTLAEHQPASTAVAVLDGQDSFVVGGEAIATAFEAIII